MSDDEETPSLSADTLAALQSFLVEKEEAEKKFAELQAQAEADFDQVKVDISAFGEDYQLSQFWVRNLSMRCLMSLVNRHKKVRRRDATRFGDRSCIGVPTGQCSVSFDSVGIL